MKMIYQGVDITKNVEVLKCNIDDNAGGSADSIELNFADNQKLWSKWRPAKGESLEVIEEKFNTGTMYVDHLEQRRGIFIMKALSIPQNAKTPRTQSWENVRFIEFASEIANRYGFKLETYNIENYHYESVHQIDQTDFEFLSFRCLLEGYVLKVNEQKLIIYDEEYFEHQIPVKTIYGGDFDGDFNFKSISTGLFSECSLKYTHKTGLVINSTFRPPITLSGPVLKKSILVSSQAEANRFTKNFLREANKGEYIGRFSINFGNDIAAGSVIRIVGVGIADGNYFVYKATHSIVNKKTTLLVRRPLEGY